VKQQLLNKFDERFPIDDFRVRWARLWHAHVETSGIPTKSGVTELLSFLTERKLPVAVATSSDRDYASLSLRAAQLGSYFDKVITGDQVVSGRPAPDIYIEAAHRLGVAAANCMAIEDSDAGVLSASAAGMITVMVPDLKPPSPHAREAAFCVVGSLVDARGVMASLCEDFDEFIRSGLIAPSGATGP
jgi:beta-phosphoglucomutase-like phosphatase (HAD superfamily)